MRAQNYGAPKLPKQLLEQVGGETFSKGGRRGQSGAGSAPVSRTEQRKTEREQKKRIGDSNALVRRKTNDKLDQETAKAESFPVTKPRPLNSMSKTTKLARKPAEPNPSNGWLSDSENDERDTVLRVSKGMRDQLAQDDTEIMAFEKKLGLKGKKAAESKAFRDDGLDDLLDGLSESDGLGPRGLKRKSGEDEDWVSKKRWRPRSSDSKNRSFYPTRGGSPEDHDSLSQQRANVISSDSEEPSSDDEHNSTDFDVSKPAGMECPPRRIKENPYIAPVPAGTAFPAKYIPPSRRAPSNADAENIQRLRRQIQGLLNRLSAANLVTILRDVEQLYQANPRQSVTSTLINFILGSVRNDTSLNDTFLILHAAFIAAIYTVVGVDFGGQLLEQFVQEFTQEYDSMQSLSMPGKQTANLISLLAQLYNFQVVGSTLLYDYIRIFLQNLSELNTELLLRIIKSSGPQLRQDDPTSLKDIVFLLQKSVAKVGEASLSVRTKFMLETITDLKNNRLGTSAASSTFTHEHMARMKKSLGSIKTRSVKAREPLRVGLNDIRDGQKKGKWWLIGASWHNPHTNSPQNSSQNASRSHSDQVDIPNNHGDDAVSSAELDLGALATQHRINNPLRRTIFITLLSATDARDAALCLQNLHLKRSQQVEIPRVLLQCCGAEGGYNPYYALVARRLCDSDLRVPREARRQKDELGRKWGLEVPDQVNNLESEGGEGSGKRMRFALAAAVWDAWRRMDEDEDGSLEIDEDEEEGSKMSMRKIMNLAKMVGTLVVDGALDITVLKVC